MYIKVRITEHCITPKYDWQSIFSVFNFVLFIIFVFEKIIRKMINRNQAYIGKKQQQHGLPVHRFYHAAFAPKR